MRIAFYQINGGSGSLFMAQTIQTLDIETLPDNIDELLEDFEGDFWEVLDD